MRVYYDRDADVNLIKGKKVAVLGYGSQGHAHANNLKDSGVADVRVALRPGSASAAKAQSAGLEVMEAAEAAKWADVVMVLVPDELQADLYRDHLAPNMREGTAMAFAHGLNIHFNLIEPRADLDIFMIAPKGPGHLVRIEYEKGGGVPSLIAVSEGASDTSFQLGLAYAKGIGGTRGGVLDTTFAEETETDLFGEQAVLCGGLSELIVRGFGTLVEAGYQPEVAYFECMHEVKLIVDLLHEGGLKKMHQFVSETAKYGDLTQGPRVVDEHTGERMKEVLKDIQDGTFAKNWVAEYDAGLPEYNRLLEEDLHSQIETVGKELRGRMSWLQE